MIDRTARNHLLAAIDDYTQQKINTAAFQERLDGVHTTDTVVREVIFRLYFLYDDFIDHPVNLSREAWDYVQRLRLLLTADVHMTKTRRWCWTRRHSSILVGSMAVLLPVALVPWDWRLFLAEWATSNACLWLLNHTQKLESAKPHPRHAPFASFAELRAIRKSTPQFCKHHYPHGMKPVPLRSERRERLMELWTVIVAPFFVPILIGFGLLSGIREERTAFHVERFTP